MLNACIALPMVLGIITGYTASIDETDDRPREMASGDEVFVGAIACPTRYPLGTKVEILGREYECLDRMNKRYRDGNHFDIYFQSRAEALTFGKQELLVSVIHE